MIRALAALAVVLMASAPGVALAQSGALPALYDVVNVAPDDVLNLRAAPGASAEKLGELAPDRTDIEVVALAPDGRWGQVNMGEGAGWVSMAFLARQPGQDAQGPLPVPLWCYGTEPFWSLEILAERVTFSDPGTDGAPLGFPREPLAPLVHSPRAPIAAGDITGFVSRESCNDGMSDRAFGWRVDFLRTGNGGSVAFSGCCTLQP